MASPFLNIIPVAAGQNNKEVTINDADIALERATNDILSVDMTGNVTLTVAQFTRHMVFRCHTILGNRQLTVPDNVGAGVGTARRVFSVIHDDTTETDLLITTGRPGGTNVILKRSMRALISSDGTNLRLVTVAGGESGVSISCFIPGGTPDLTPLLRYVSAINFTLPAGLVGSKGDVMIAPDGGAAIFDLRLNNVSFGSMTFSNGDNHATFSLASTRNVNPGDILSVHSPSDTYDMSDLTFSILGT
jgi:hypothetical protein